MSKVNRRDFLKTTAGAAVGASLLTGGGVLTAPAVAADAWKNTPEKGASLRVLRWKRFVQGDEDAYLANVKKFTEKFNIPVRVDSEGWEDVRPKAAVAANVGSGPDIILSTHDDPALYPEKLVDVSDVANYLGKKYGGWYPVAEAYCKRGNTWIALPLGIAGTAIVYRESLVKAAGFDKFPTDTDGFLKLMQALKKKNTPGGFALGHATGDGNSWTHWCLWSFGGKLVDQNNNVVINSPETIKALEYAKELYQTFVPGTLSWLDPSNNKAFLDGQVSLTGNGISIYYAAKNSKDPKVMAMTADIQHSNMPIGPIGVPAELSLFFNQMLFKYSKYPKAGKEFLRFMMEEEQYGAWLQGGIGYVSQPLKAYYNNPIWTADPKHAPYREIIKNMRPIGYAGKSGYASAGAAADFIVVDMMAEAASGKETPKAAAERAEKRAQRYYKI
ncbi:MAG TPA: substrate-binding domain-containing protein [Polyangia bacterium]|jgi:multiple sugar transport system substrate-binding protein|nr:substrate-binding domain-containing protein [Polyangia bacterium]